MWKRNHVFVQKLNPYYDGVELTDDLRLNAIIAFSTFKRSNITILILMHLQASCESGYINKR